MPASKMAVRQAVSVSRSRSNDCTPLIGFGRFLEAKVKEAELLLFLLYDYREPAIPYSLPPRMILLAVLLKSQ